MDPLALASYLDTLVANHLMTSVMIWGAPGIGKSSVVRQVGERRNLDFVDLRLSQLAPTDLRGLPVPLDGVTRWAPPEFLPSEGEGILFLDEINMAPPAMQGVAQQLILDRKVGSYRLPEGWFVWAAGNRKEDRAAVFAMPAPVANRFIHLDLEADIASFRRYALGAGFHERVVSFLAFRPELLMRFDAESPAWPSPRSWEIASRLYAAGLEVTPAVGSSAGHEFDAFVDLLDGVPDLDAIMKGKSKADFPDEMSLRYATVVGLASRVEKAEQAAASFNWLIDSAQPEWVQMFAVDLFPKLRERGSFAETHAALIADPQIRDFLTDFALLASGA